MKRFILVLCMVFMGIGLCACEDKIEQKNEIVTVTAAPTQAGVSGDSVTTTEQPVISTDRAFSMAEDVLKTMTLEEKVGQMFLVDLSQLDRARTKDGNITKYTKSMKESMDKYHVGGVYLSPNNVSSVKQTTKMISELQKSASGGALYVAVEEEGGGEYSLSAKVPDLQETGFTTQSEMGKNMTEEQVYQTGKTIAEELTPLGINLNLAPVADLASSENEEYADRCFGADSDAVDGMLTSMVTGMRDGGLATTLKYFPGIGNVKGEYTEEILENQDSLMSLRNNNFATYTAGIEAGTDCVMVGNISASKITMKKIPAFMSEEIVTSLLREELQFDGVIMTSPLNDNVIAKNYTVGFATLEAVKAGCDMIVLPGNLSEGFNALVGAVRTGKMDEKVINTAVLRILRNKIQRGILVLDNK